MNRVLSSNDVELTPRQRRGSLLTRPPKRKSAVPMPLSSSGASPVPHLRSKLTTIAAASLASATTPPTTKGEGGHTTTHGRRTTFVRQPTMADDRWDNRDDTLRTNSLQKRLAEEFDYGADAALWHRQPQSRREMCIDCLSRNGIDRMLDWAQAIFSLVAVVIYVVQTYIENLWLEPSLLGTNRLCRLFTAYSPLISRLLFSPFLIDF